MEKNFSIIIPVLNEEKAIAETIEKVKQAMTGSVSEIIVVNDGSTDKTGEILNQFNGLRVINHPYSLGYGASIKDGIKIAKYDWIVITDADGTYPIEDLPKLIKYTDTYDMVVGSRTGEKVKVPFFRRPAKKIITILANFLTGKKILDLNSGLRIFKKSIAIQFSHLFPSGFSLTTTLTLACLTNDFTVKYVPINYHKRQGKSSIRPLRDFFGFLSLVVRIIMYFNPLKFFLIPGIAIMTLGILAGIYTLAIQGNITDTTIILTVTGLQIIFIGLIADLIVRSRK